MEWDAIGVIAEIAGVVTVVATLIFLAVEVRNSRNATEAVSVDALATGFNTLHAHLITDPEFAQTWFAGLANPDAVDEVTRMRIGLQLQSYLNHYGAVRRHYESGILQKEDLESYSIGVAAFMNSPGGRRLFPGFSIPGAVTKDMDDYKDRAVTYAWLVGAENGIE